MAATVERLARARTARPAAWDALLPWDGEQGTLWQVWMRPKGAGYWLMRYATKLSRLLGANVTNPNGLEDGGVFGTEDEARDLCRIVYARTRGAYAVTVSPVVVGRAYSVESVMAAGDFDPFRVFDFSATDAVREQAKHVLVSVEVIEQLTADLTGIRRLAEPRV